MFLDFTLFQGRIEIKIDDNVVFGLDMYYIAELAEQYKGNLTAENAEALMKIILKLLDFLKTNFKTMSLYKGSDELVIPEGSFAQPDVNYEYLRYDNGRTK